MSVRPLLHAQLISVDEYQANPHLILADGRSVSVKDYPELAKVMQVPRSLLDTVDRLSGDYGEVLVTSQLLGSPPWGCFAPIGSTSVELINPNRNWLANSANLNEAQVIGYKFKKGPYIIDKVTFVPRIGDLATPMKLGPSPKHVVIEGVDAQGKTHQLGEHLNLKVPTQPFQLYEFTFDHQEPLCLVRMIIKSWHANGITPADNWPVGLYAFQLFGYPALTMELPELSSPCPGYVWVYETMPASIEKPQLVSAEPLPPGQILKAFDPSELMGTAPSVILDEPLTGTLGQFGEMELKEEWGGPAPSQIYVINEHSADQTVAYSPCRVLIIEGRGPIDVHLQEDSQDITVKSLCDGLVRLHLPEGHTFCLVLPETATSKSYIVRPATVTLDTLGESLHICHSGKDWYII